MPLMRDTILVVEMLVGAVALAWRFAHQCTALSVSPMPLDAWWAARWPATTPRSGQLGGAFCATALPTACVLLATPLAVWWWERPRAAADRIMWREYDAETNEGDFIVHTRQ